MKFRSLIDRGKSIKRPRQFSKVMPTYVYEIDKETGRKKVVQNGTQNMYKLKQEALEQTLIYNIIDRIERTGDMSLLGEAVESEFDATVLPRDMMEAKMIQCKVENIFRALPIEEKRKYKGDISQFYKHVNDVLHKNAQEAAEKAREASKAPDTPPASEGGNK